MGAGLSRSPDLSLSPRLYYPARIRMAHLPYASGITALYRDGRGRASQETVILLFEAQTCLYSLYKQVILLRSDHQER